MAPLYTQSRVLALRAKYTSCVLSDIVGYSHVCPDMAGFVRIWPGQSGYDRSCRGLAENGRVWQHMAVSDQVWLVITGAGRVLVGYGRYIAGYGLLWPRITPSFRSSRSGDHRRSRHDSTEWREGRVFLRKYSDDRDYRNHSEPLPRHGRDYRHLTTTSRDQCPGSKGKVEGHLPGVGRVLPGQATNVNLMMKLFRSDDKFSQMLNQYESTPEFGSRSGGCGDDEMAYDDTRGTARDEEDEEEGDS
ncbi:hypothetical protein Tco_1193998 [Tanacetum coccineum]